jgi:hypothetical protein
MSGLTNMDLNLPMLVHYVFAEAKFPEGIIPNPKLRKIGMFLDYIRRAKIVHLTVRS